MSLSRYRHSIIGKGIWCGFKSWSERPEVARCTFSGSFCDVVGLDEDVDSSWKYSEGEENGGRTYGS